MSVYLDIMHSLIEVVWISDSAALFDVSRIEGLVSLIILMIGTKHRVQTIVVRVKGGHTFWAVKNSLAMLDVRTPCFLSLHPVLLGKVIDQASTAHTILAPFVR